MTDALTESEREAVRGIIHNGSAAKAAKELGVSRSTLMTALAGEPIHEGLLLLIRTKLSARPSVTP